MIKEYLLCSGTHRGLSFVIFRDQLLHGDHMYNATLKIMHSQRAISVMF